MNHLTASWRRLASSTGYVLVHPEAFPSNDWPVDDAAYGASVLAAGQRAQHRAVILDEYGIEDLADDALDNTYPGSFSGWTVVQAEPHELGPEIVGKIGFPAAITVRVGGFHRGDCVRRVVEQFTRAGYVVVLDDETTLP